MRIVNDLKRRSARELVPPVHIAMRTPVWRPAHGIEC